MIDLSDWRDFIIMAGPCAVESKQQINATAKAVSELGLSVLRGGAFKARTDPHSFQGLKKAGLKLLQQAGREYNLRVITEVLDTRDVELVAAHADILQIGARSMRNYELLKEVSKTGKPVLLKRGLAATLDEWFRAAAYIGENVILCERGHRCYMPHVRFMLDFAAIHEAQQKGYSVVIDPSHAAGKRELVPSLSLAAFAAGADGLLIEAHPDPESALSDARQQLTLHQLDLLVSEIRRLAALWNRKVR